MPVLTPFRLFLSFCQNVNLPPARFGHSRAVADACGNARISRVATGAECKRFRASSRHDAGAKSAPAAVREGGRKPGACPACRFDIVLLPARTCQIEKKRAPKARPRLVSRRISGRQAEAVAETCGEKKRFFSRTVFSSPEIGACFKLKKQNSGLEL